MPTLTELRVKAAKPAEKPYKLFDQRGLFMLVTPAGGRLWRFKYKRGGVEKLLTLGQYPEVSLKRAREKRDDARRQLSDGVDPTLKRRAEEASAANTFQAVADEWLMTKKHALTPATWARDRRQIYKWVVPYLGSKPIASIEAPDLLAVLKKIEAKGVIDTAHRSREVCGRVFRYAIATGRAKHDIAADLVGALASRTTTHHAAIIDPVKVGELLRAIDGYDGQPTTAAALRLAPYVFVRPTELRAAEWSEMNLDGEQPEWRIPAERMKMRETHIVPLSRQAVGILRELVVITGRQRYVFPAIGGGGRPISENTLNGALRRIGYPGDVMTAHGFRTMASTLLNEQGVHPDLIELQLAHAERNTVRAAYNRAQRLAERRVMMQNWADYNVRDVLNGKREIDTSQARTLASRFHVSAAVFMRDSKHPLRRSPDRTKPTATKRTSRTRASAKTESVVVYRGIKIPQISGKRSPTAEALRDALRARSEKLRDKSG